MATATLRPRLGVRLGATSQALSRRLTPPARASGSASSSSIRRRRPRGLETLRRGMDGGGAWREGGGQGQTVRRERVGGARCASSGMGGTPAPIGRPAGRVLDAVKRAAAAFWKNELYRRALITFFIVAVVRVGYFVPMAGFDRRFMPASVGLMGNLAGALNVVGDQESSIALNIFELGVGPFISASILMQVMANVPDTWFSKQKKEGQPGFEKLQKATRWVALGFALAMSLYTAIVSKPYAVAKGARYISDTVITLTAGSMVVQYLGEAISEYGMGGGTTVIIGLSIMASYGSALNQLLEVMQSGSVPVAAACGSVFLFSLLVAGGVWLNEGLRKIPISYYQSEGGPVSRSTDEDYIPFKVNPTGMQPVLIASYVMDAPRLLAQMTGNPILMGFAGALSPSLPAEPGALPWLYYGMYFVIVFSSTFLDLEDMPKEINEYLGRVGARVKGVKPGPTTVRYLRRAQTGARFWGGLLLGILATFGSMCDNYAKAAIGTYVGFTSLLIVVGMIQATRRQMAAYMQAPRMEAIINRQLSKGAL